jgi:hypothetical protein
MLGKNLNILQIIIIIIIIIATYYYIYYYCYFFILIHILSTSNFLKETSNIHIFSRSEITE